MKIARRAIGKGLKQKSELEICWGLVLRAHYDITHNVYYVKFHYYHVPQIINLPTGCDA